jgi:Flp pilus assembly protein TadD
MGRSKNKQKSTHYRDRPPKQQGRAAVRPAARRWSGVVFALAAVGLVAAVGFAISTLSGKRNPPKQGQAVLSVPGDPGSNQADSGLGKIATQRRKDTEASELNQVANNLLRAGDFPAAIQTYKQALKLAPNDEDLHFNLGVALAKNGQFTNAEAEYRQALKLLPDYPEVHNNLANVLMRLGKTAEAEAHFNEALKEMPEYAQAHNNLGILHQQARHTNEALLCFQKAVEYDTNYWEAHFNLANAYLRVQNTNKAIAELRETLRINSQFKPAEELLAREVRLLSNSTPP